MVRAKSSPEPWVVSQHRTMSLWVSSMVGEPVSDFTTDLADGLILYKLVNRIIADSANSGYTLKPIYSRANFKVQKVENVDDVLKYCHLVLKINTTSFSADNVVDGNLKLILGLIWTLFVYSTSCSISFKSESRSFSEVRAILLKWLNDLGRRRALPEIANFDKDWSLQRNARPDLVFASILDFYIPNLVSFSAYAQGKKLQNLETVIGLAWEDFKIPKLAVAEDFNVLAPDEKCVICYILQWYIYFEVQEVGDEPVSFESKDWVHTFMKSVVDAVKVRNKYDTRALRLVNQTNINISKLSLLLKHMDDYIAPFELSEALDRYCGEFQEKTSLADQVASRSGWSSIHACIASLTDLLQKHLHFRLMLKPEFVYHDFPELKTLFKAVNVHLKDIGVFSGYLPLKLLCLESIGARLQKLAEVDSALASKVSKQLDEILKSHIGALDTLVDSLESRLRSSEHHTTDEIRTFIDNLDYLQSFKDIVCRSNEQLRGNHTTSDIRALVDSMETLHMPITPDTPEDSSFARFNGLVRMQKNQSNLTYSDAKNFLRQILPSGDVDSITFNDFLNLIPTRKLLYRSESDDFNISYASDDSEESASIFDHVQKTLENKLLGNHNKLYDLDGLVVKIEGGFRI